MEMLYAKYNRERLPEFQLGTFVYKSDGKLIVKKRALTDKGASHVRNIYHNYQLLGQKKAALVLAVAELADDGVQFEFVKGESLEYRLLRAAIDRDKHRIRELLESYSNILKDAGVRNYRNYRSCLGFEAVFGKHVEMEKADCFDISNIDMSFENIIFHSGENYKIIDYEWVFDFPIPVNYIIYRGVTLFFRNIAYLNDFMTIEEMWEYFGISNDEVQLYNQLNAGITNYVYGSSKNQHLLGNYSKSVLALNDMLHSINGDSKAVAEREKEMAGKDRQIVELEQCMVERDRQIAQCDQWLRERDLRIKQLLDSGSWKVTAPLRRLAAFVTRRSGK